MAMRPPSLQRDATRVPLTIDVLRDMATTRVDISANDMGRRRLTSQMALVSRSHSVRSLRPIRPPLIARVTRRMSS